jgi:hypothetical protein
MYRRGLREDRHLIAAGTGTFAPRQRAGRAVCVASGDFDWRLVRIPTGGPLWLSLRQWDQRLFDGRYWPWSPAALPAVAMETRGRVLNGVPPVTQPASRR